jgi:hypothetical protein
VVILTTADAYFNITNEDKMYNYTPRGFGLFMFFAIIWLWFKGKSEEKYRPKVSSRTFMGYRYNYKTDKYDAYYQ